MSKFHIHVQHQRVLCIEMFYLKDNKNTISYNHSLKPSESFQATLYLGRLEQHKLDNLKHQTEITFLLKFLKNNKNNLWDLYCFGVKFHDVGNFKIIFVYNFVHLGWSSSYQTCVALYFSFLNTLTIWHPMNCHAIASTCINSFTHTWTLFTVGLSSIIGGYLKQNTDLN